MTHLRRLVDKEMLPQSQTLESLQHAIENFTDAPWTGLNAQMTCLRVFAACCVPCFADDSGGCNVYRSIGFRVYIVGSAKNGDAAWAFTVLVDIQVGNDLRFAKLGFVCGMVDNQLLGPASCDAWPQRSLPL